MQDPNLEHQKNAPTGKTHWPVLTADYQRVDSDAGYGDACFMDIGQSTWNKEDFSAKIWRWSDSGQRWSRQGEELPLSRVLDLATLVAAATVGKTSELQEFIQNSEQKAALQNYLTDNMQVLGPKLDELRRILQPAVVTHQATERPNLFNFATSELSQDAMFTWLLSWANPDCKKQDSSLHSVALDFVALLTGEDGIIVKKIEAGRQWEHIDIWAEINDDVFLAIEDKTGTTVHDDQLERYKKIVEEAYPDRKRFYAYIKTRNEPKSTLRAVENAGYRIILRREIIDCLDKYTGENVLLCDYRAHLRTLEEETQSFNSLPLTKWSWSAWEGFYKALELQIDVDMWSYVPNPSGGFLGAWWHFIPFAKTWGKGEMYLQFEQGNLCFKISPTCERGERSAIRDNCYNLLMTKVNERYPEIVRPTRFGAGKYMTIARVHPTNLFGETKINLNSVVDKLKQYESLIDECCSK